MTDFAFHNPTRILFGRERWCHIGTELAAMGYKRVLLLYGQGSVVRSGLLEAVLSAIREAQIEVVPYGGVKPNPDYHHAVAGAILARTKRVEAVVALGGGSVMDEAKGIAVGACDEGELWDFYDRRRTIVRALPVVTIPTLAATGSEMNGNSVLTRGESKYNFASIHAYPKLSILSPELTMSISPAQQAYASVDAMSHILEGYFTKLSPNPLIDHLCEAALKSIKEATEAILADQTVYEPRAQFMWAATLALNGSLQTGLDRFSFPNHILELPLSAKFDIAHGAGLSIVLPAWMRWYLPQARAPFERFGRELFGTTTAEEAIAALESWFVSIGAPVRLAQVGITAEAIPDLARLANELAKLRGGLDKLYTISVCTQIFESAL